MIKIEVIPHENQRYNTVGDWQRLGDDVIIYVSQMNNGLCEFLVGIHELIEIYLCEAYGITDEEVTAWDKAHPDHPDPGSIPGCPYYNQHFFATIVEKMIAAQLDVDWAKYEEAIEAL